MLGATEGLLGIGQLARTSELTVSALLFSDGAGVLTPAFVDQETGYRRYINEQMLIAQLIGRLRRIKMTLADIRQVVAKRLRL